MPVVDSVPLIICGLDIVMFFTPAEAGAATAKLLNVFVPPMLDAVVVVDVRDTLLNVRPSPPDDPTIMFPPAAVITILEVPALSVMPVLVAAEIPPLVSVTVLLPRLIVRVLLLLDDRDPAVTA